MWGWVRGWGVGGWGGAGGKFGLLNLDYNLAASETFWQHKIINPLGTYLTVLNSFSVRDSWVYCVCFSQYNEMNTKRFCLIAFYIFHQIASCKFAIPNIWWTTRLEPLTGVASIKPLHDLLLVLLVLVYQSLSAR